MVLMLSLLLQGCFTIPLDPAYKGPPTRPAEFDEYYSTAETVPSSRIELVGEKERFSKYKITIESSLDPIVIDYFKRPEENDRLVIVFPVLGGSNTIAEYFARYFARNGFDTAIIHRNDSFKKPENFDRMEQIFREDVLRDRIALTYFEKEQGKKNFGSFGISRGGINVAITAGVDDRLKHNVIALGGTDLVSLFRNSNQRRIEKYINTVMEQKGISRDEFFEQLEKMLRTDPKHLSKYIDARHTLMLLAMFDRTVPFEYGQKLREEIGTPETVYLVANHYSALLFTQYLKFLPPTREVSFLPIDYVETEALTFYHRSFETGNRCGKPLWLRVLQVPMNIVGRLVDLAF